MWASIAQTRDVEDGTYPKDGFSDLILLLERYKYSHDVLEKPNQKVRFVRN